MLILSDAHPIDRAEEILTPEALAFIEELNRRFAPARKERMTDRAAKREQANKDRQ